MKKKEKKRKTKIETFIHKNIGCTKPNNETKNETKDHIMKNNDETTPKVEMSFTLSHTPSITILPPPRKKLKII